ncbi:RNA polymerase sigma factor [Anaerolentibacter hominis]|uniref:RNA polymerase sigma factor n=1 Tax=Anaerolentibacter hominis TaxID=3079009 RepID=UPI0031B8AD99
MGKINAEQYLESLIDSYQNLIYTICYRMVNDYFEAEDLTQETFLAAYRNLAAFDRQHEKAWLIRIARNKCLDVLRRSGKREIIPSEEEFFLAVADQGESPEESVLNRQVQEELRTFCEELKPPYREVAVDYFCEELEPAVIARKRNKNLKTIQTQIYRAKDMLKKKYRKERL